jgi:hypothetical protein
MLRQILRVKTALMFSLALSLFCPGVFAQGHEDRHDGGDNGRNIKRDAGPQERRDGHGSQHFYNNGRWYKHGWFGWDVAVPVLSAGVFVDSLPTAYTVVIIQGNTYYHGDNTYFRQVSTGGFTVVTGL